MEYSLCLVFFILVAGSSCLRARRSHVYEQCDSTRTSVDIHEHPYLVDINGCVGTMISPKWILTGNHCAHNYFYGKHAAIESVRIGSHIGDEGVRVEVETNIEHPQFNNHNSIKYDFLLLKLKGEPLKLETVGPLIRGLLNPTDPQSKDMTSAITYGFGFSCDEEQHDKPINLEVRLMSQNVTVISEEECRRSFPDANLNGVICAKPPVNYCDETGGPLMLGGVLVGVTSTVPQHDCSSTDPIVFAPISVVRDWIRNYIE